MDTTKPSEFSISPSELIALWRIGKTPLVIDVRRENAYFNSDCNLPGALRRDPSLIDSWIGHFAESTAVVVYCVHGHEVSQNAMQALRQRGVDAKFLLGGIENWRAAGFPINSKPSGQNSRWVTRAKPKIDRIACPWLIRRFVDAQAEFLYVETSQVQQVAMNQNATPYDVNATVAETLFTHKGDRCSFDAFMLHYRLEQDAALVLLSTIVRAADTDRLNQSPESAGLLAISLGMSRLYQNDHEMLAAMMSVYDALYAWCLDKVAGKAEQHNWKPA
jgi:rhodanese-related sulfurtransferase